MTTATLSISANALRRALPIVFAIGALAVMTSHVQAAELDKLTIDRPIVKLVGRDESTEAPIEDVTVVAHVIPDPDTLTTDSGVVLLKDYVLEAARKACFAADPMAPDDGTCVHKALLEAKPQMAALIAQAKSKANG
jgi:hypothetical protein